MLKRRLAAAEAWAAQETVMADENGVEQDAGGRLGALKAAGELRRCPGGRAALPWRRLAS